MNIFMQVRSESGNEKGSMRDVLSSCLFVFPVIQGG